MNPITELIKSQERPSKAKKATYRKPESVRELEQLYFDWHYTKYSVIPENARFVTKFRDDSANGLTKCVLTYLKIRGAFASRINTTGIYRNDIKKFVPNTQKKGLADVAATYKSFSLQIEIKVGRDKMSNKQNEVKTEFELSGGYWFTAQDFTSFKDWFDTLFINI